MKRRRFLQFTSALPVALQLDPSIALHAQPAQPRPTLVLVELAGGNDGLNTVVPYRSAEYRRLRPTLALSADAVIRLGPELGLHPSLETIKPIWDEGDLAVISGVGYPNPSRSHFRAIEIWETGSDSPTPPDEGWVGRALGGRAKASTSIDGLVLGDADLGPLQSTSARALLMARPDVFFRIARQMGAMKSSARAKSNPGLAHIMAVQSHIAVSARELSSRLASQPSVDGFDSDAFGRQLATVARLIVADAPVSTYKVTLAGFDTHVNQAPRHRRLLDRLGRGLKALRDAVGKAERWNQTVVMTYSEFGRRVKENGSRGTDHGTAAPVFVMGGRVRGGHLGQTPSLSALDGGDLRYTVDFRRIYKTLLTRHLGLPTTKAGWPKQRHLPLIDASA